MSRETDREIDDRAQRLGLGDARNFDVLADAQLTMLKLFCHHLEQAMEDEALPPNAARAVLMRVIQGSLPHPLDAQIRMDAAAKQVQAMNVDLPSLRSVGDIPAWQTHERID